MLNRFHCFGDGGEYIKQDIALYLGQSVNTTALPLIVDRRVSTLMKKSVYLSNASLSMKRVLPSALSSGVVPELFGHKPFLSWRFFMSFLSSKDWISSAFLLIQKSCMSLSLLWTVLQTLLYADYLDTEHSS